MERKRHNTQTGKTATDDLSEIFKEFGIPEEKPVFNTKPKLHSEGTKCPLNPNCEKVNTNYCDIMKCQDGTIRRARRS